MKKLINPTTNQTIMKKLIAVLLAAIGLVGCADPAFQQYIASRQAAIANMPNGQQKFYEQARLDEQILADKQRQQAQAAQAAAAIGAGMANAGAIYAARAQTPIIYTPPVHVYVH
jgi:hypothetical protein